MGVMTAYSSHNSKTNTNVAGSEKAISLRLLDILLISLFIYVSFNIHII